MEILQGRYLKRNDDKARTFKTISLKTDDGIQTIRLPKMLRMVAQQELSPGDLIRVWVTPQAKKGKKSKKSMTKKGKKRSLEALQLIPLSPKANVTLPTPKAKATEGKKAGKKQMRVQICQKKNCCKRGGTKLWEAFKQVSNNSQALPTFKLEAVGCLGGCNRGPNMRFLPDNVKHYHVKPKDGDRLLQQHQPSQV